MPSCHCSHQRPPHLTSTAVRAFSRDSTTASEHQPMFHVLDIGTWQKRNVVQREHHLPHTGTGLGQTGVAATLTTPNPGRGEAMATRTNKEGPLGSVILGWSCVFFPLFGGVLFIPFFWVELRSWAGSGSHGGDEDITRVPETVVEDVLEDVEVTRATQAAFLSLDSVDLTVMFKTRAKVMRSPPKFLRGAYKSAMRVALHEWQAGEVVQSEARKSRAWKLFVLLPRMLLFKPPRGSLVAKSKMVEGGPPVAQP